MLKYFAASIIYGMMVLIGLLFLVIPGIIIALKYQFYGYLIVDRHMDPIEALKGSSRLTNGALTNLFVFWMALYCGITIIMIIFMIFVVIPVSLIGMSISPDLVGIFYIIYIFIISFIGALIITPIANLAKADIYRILEARLMAPSDALTPALAEGV